MLRSEVTGPRRRAPPWRVILARVREQHWRVREEDLDEGGLLLNGRGRMHALDEMLHWRDPVERLRTLRRRRRTLIDDNPSSG